MAIDKVRRRDGELIPFDRSRIETAIRLACDATGETDQAFIPVLVDDIVRDIEHVYTEIFVHRVPSVEDIQDIVERNLVKANRFELAKSYIIYRAKRRDERGEKQLQLVKEFEENQLTVTKKDGTKEVFDVTKLRIVFDRASKGLEEQCEFTDLMEAFKKNLIEDIKTEDIEKLLVKTCIDLVTVENIAWQHIAARILLGGLYKQATDNRGLTHKDIYTPESYKALFDEYIEKGLYYKKFYDYYTPEDILEAGKHLSLETDETYEYTTIVSCGKRYLLNPNKVVKELPQEMYMSIALFLAIPEPKETRLEFALKVYEHCSKQRISLPTPTLLNSRTNFHQLSSCFKINVDDDLRGIYHAIENMSQISKYGGGVGVYLGNIRARGARIRNVKGASGGVNPWIKVINDTAVAVNQLGARLGAISVTLDVWHADIYDFLDLQTETGDIRAKAFDIFPAVSMPDIFMQRVNDDGDWTLFDPYEIGKLYGKNLQDTFSEEFSTFYAELEADDRLEMKRTVKAKDLFKKFLKTTVETGMPYVFYRDTVNRLNPNKHAGNIYSTQLCTEICQNTSTTKFVEEVIEDGKIVIRYEPGDLVVCNLASINVATVHEPEVIASVFPVVMRVLDNVIT
jgi:ribonucleoside-diphosphate reductase alpha chain